MDLSTIFAGGSTFSQGLVGAVSPLPPLPGTIPAGFDAIMQCSAVLLQTNLAANLARRGLNPITLRVPYQPALVSPGLRAAIQPHVKPHDFTHGGVFLEVELQGPVLQALHWPPLVTGGGTTGEGTTAESAAPRDRSVDLNCALAINVFKPGIGQGGVLDPGLASVARARPSDTPGGGGGTEGQPPHTPPTPPAPPSPPEASRVTVATGTASMHVQAHLVTTAPVRQFRIELNFEDVQPTYASQDPNLVEFFKTDFAGSLLAQTVAPLLSQADVGLSPTVALAGSLTTSQITQAQLPAVHAGDVLLQTDQGPVLALCANVGSGGGGVLSLVRPFVAGQDFAYYVSDKVFTPVIKGVWRANAIQTPIVSDIPLEMPVAPDSDETGTGHATVQVNLSNTIKEVGIKATTDGKLGDPLRLVSEQTVHLLALTDPNGKPVGDLGDLAKPTVEPFPLSLQLFDSVPPGSPQQIHPALEQLLVALLIPIVYPVVEPFTVADLGGFTSSPLRAVVTRWNLASPLDQTHGPPGGGVLEGA